MYKYLLLERPRKRGAQPEDYHGWEDFEGKRLLPEYGREAWGILYYHRELGPKEVAAFDLLPCGEVSVIEHLTGYRV